MYTLYVRFVNHEGFAVHAKIETEVYSFQSRLHVGQESRYPTIHMRVHSRLCDRLVNKVKQRDVIFREPGLFLTWPS